MAGLHRMKGLRLSLLNKGFEVAANEPIVTSCRVQEVPRDVRKVQR